MKRTLSIILALVMALTVAACSANGDGKDNGSSSALTGTASEVMAAINEGTDYADAPKLAEEPLTADNCASTIGITADELSANVTDGVINYAMISSIAYMSAVVKCKDAAAAGTIKDAIAAGFDMQRWVCVIPDTAFVTTSGEYVYFVAAYSEYADALWTSYTTLTGDASAERTEIN